MDKIIVILLSLMLSIISIRCSGKLRNENYYLSQVERTEAIRTKEKIDKILLQGWHSEIMHGENPGNFYVKSDSLFEFKKYGKYVIENYSIQICFSRKRSEDHVENKIYFHDSVCNQMKRVYAKVYPNKKLPLSPFLKLQVLDSNRQLIEEYNKLSMELWINENLFYKCHTITCNVVFYTTPDINYNLDTNYSYFKSVFKQITKSFQMYPISCQWEEQ